MTPLHRCSTALSRGHAASQRLSALLGLPKSRVLLRSILRTEVGLFGSLALTFFQICAKDIFRLPAPEFP